MRSKYQKGRSKYQKGAFKIPKKYQWTSPYGRSKYQKNNNEQVPIKMDQYQNNYVQNTYKGRGAEGGGA